MASRQYDRDRGRGRSEARQTGERDDRGIMSRAGDEVRSWFGDEEADRRRRMDERWNEQRSREERYSRSRSGGYEPRAGDVMTRNVVSVHPEDTIERAAWLMGECDCGALPVVDGNSRLIGMITDRDITVRIAGRGLDPRRARVEECMTREAFACHANDSIEECMRQMAQHQIRRLPIVYDDNRLAGIISQADLARRVGSGQERYEDHREMNDYLYEVSEPSRGAYR